MRTSTSGYVQRRMVKVAEDLQVKYDNTVRGVNGSIIQFSYGDVSLDRKTSVILNDEVHVCDVGRLAQKLNYQHEIRLRRIVVARAGREDMVLS